MIKNTHHADIAICKMFIIHCEMNKAAYKFVLVLNVEQISNYSYGYKGTGKGHEKEK